MRSSSATLQGAAGAAAPQGAAQGLQRPEGQRDAGRRSTRARQQPREPVPRDTKKNFVEISAGPVTIPGRTAAELTGRPGSAGRGIRNCGVTHRVHLLRSAVWGRRDSRADRKSVVWGKGGSVSVVPGGVRSIKKKTSKK